MRLQANCVYVPPPGMVVTFRGYGRFYPTIIPAPTNRVKSIQISMLFSSLAEGLEEDAVGVILSGTGSDGALGLKAIKQKVNWSRPPRVLTGTGPQHDGMPLSAIATGAIDIVAAVEAMPGRIMAVQGERGKSDGLATLSLEKADAARLAICIDPESDHRS